MALHWRFWPSVFCLYHPLLIVAGLTGFSFIKYFFCEIQNKTTYCQLKPFWNVLFISFFFFPPLLVNTFWSEACLFGFPSIKQNSSLVGFWIIFYHHFLISCFTWNLSLCGIKQKLLLTYLICSLWRRLSILKHGFLLPWFWYLRYNQFTTTVLKWKLLDGLLFAILDKPLIFLPQFSHL